MDPLVDLIFCRSISNCNTVFFFLQKVHLGLDRGFFLKVHISLLIPSLTSATDGSITEKVSREFIALLIRSECFFSVNLQDPRIQGGRFWGQKRSPIIPQ